MKERQERECCQRGLALCLLYTTSGHPITSLQATFLQLKIQLGLYLKPHKSWGRTAIPGLLEPISGGCFLSPQKQ